MQTPQDLPSSSIMEALPCSISSYSLAMVKNIMQNQIPEEEDKGAFHLFGFPVKSPESSRVFTTVKNHGIRTIKKLGIRGSSRLIKKSSENANGDSLSKSFRLFGVWIECPGALGGKKLGVKETRGGVQHVRQDRSEDPLGVFLGKKVLTTSDIDSSSRLLLGRSIKLNQIMPFLKKEVAQLCNTTKGAEFKVWDLDTKTEHTLVLKMWVTKSFVFTGNWMKDFVKRRNLKKDNEIGLYWDESGSRFNFTVLRQI